MPYDSSYRNNKKYHQINMLCVYFCGKFVF